MTVLEKLRRASWPQRWALVEAALLLGVARTALRLLPFRTILRLTDGVEPRSGADAGRLARRVWAIEIMGNRLFPTNPCLTQAILVQALMRRAGQDTRLRIGVRREGRETLEAHAWVERDGAILIGRKEAEQGYVPLPSFRPGG
jgi:hypothetical protein